MFFFRFFEAHSKTSNIPIFFLDLGGKIIDFERRSTYLIGNTFCVYVIGINNSLFHLVQEFKEFSWLFIIAPHKLSFKECEHSCGERLEVLELQGRVATLSRSYHPSPNSTQKLINSCVELLEGLNQIFT